MKKQKNLRKTQLYLERKIEKFLSGKKYIPLGRTELIQQLQLPPTEVAICRKVLTNMISRGIIVRKKGRHSLKKSSKDTTVGVIHVHPRGFGFVEREKGKDIFIPKSYMHRAVDGDLVEISIDPKESVKGPEGQVVSIVERKRTHLAGTIRYCENHHFIAHAPILGPTKPVFVYANKKRKLRVGDRILMKVLKWGNEEDWTECRMTEYLGHISDPSCDIKCAIEEFELRDTFSKAAIQQAKKYGTKIPPGHLKHRKNLTNLECVTIDPDTAKDFDDAISLTKDEKGNFHLGVHIADVAHYVHPNSPLDSEAFSRCNSTYFPTRCIPMLPEELSNHLCSLRPKVLRLTVSVLMIVDKNGNISDYQIVRSYIKSRKRLTYKKALEILEKKRSSPHAPLLKRMTELCEVLKKKRFDRGSIDFALPEAVIKVTEKGIPTGIEIISYDITHQMIEEFMLKANEAVAQHLSQKERGLIYRTHEEPSAENFHDFFTTARALGFQIPPNPTQRDIQKLFINAKDSPYISQLSVSFIRNMKLACYSPENLGHYGLALEKYCHFTSPIRRYSDLIIQRLIFGEETDSDLAPIANACSNKERISMRAENSVILLKKLRLLDKYLHEDAYRQYQASITKIKPFALFFEITEFYIEGSLHLSQIEEDYFNFDTTHQRLQGRRTGKIYSFGDKILVRLKSIDLIKQESEWELIQTPPKKKKRRK